MKKPKNIPTNAFYDDGDQAWAVGKKDASGRKIGAWVYWRDDGSKEGDEEWGDGTKHLTYRRFHLDGSVAQSAAKDLTLDRLVGIGVWTRLDKPSIEDRYWPMIAPANARRFEKHFNEQGQSFTEKIFDKDNRRITTEGNPFPERPATVDDENAYLIDEDNLWMSGKTSADNTQAYGLYRTWDREGILAETRVYDDAGVCSRIEEYRNGTLWMSKDYNGNELLQSFYRTNDNGAPVLRSSTLYRNQQKDRRETHYDKAGKPLYSVRMEEVTDEHVRRYDNDQLVFEAQWNKDSSTPPVVKYFDGDRLLIDYQSQSRGTGTFTLFKPDGSVEATLDVTDAKDLSEYGNWDRFMPGFAHYDAKRTETDVQAVRTNFLEVVAEVRFAAAARKVTVPARWNAINKVEWKKSGSANGRAPIDKWLVMMLGDDPQVAADATSLIWNAIEEQDCLFQATYDVALTLTRLLPALSGNKELHTRAVAELAKIMCLPGMPHEIPKRYAAVIAELRKQAAALAAFVKQHDDDTGRNVMQVLALLQQPDSLRARLVDAKASAATRAFAAAALSAMPCATEKIAKAHRAATVAAIQAAWKSERNVPLRTVLGVLASLLQPEQGSGDPVIDKLLVHYMMQPAKQRELVAVWQPLVRYLGDDIQSTLFRAVPAATRNEHISLVVERLPNRNILEQAEDLDVIFATLFVDGGDGLDTNALTPLQRKALHAAADVVAANAGFVNHGEIFRKHDLPWNAFELRELAKAESKASTATQASGAPKAPRKVLRPVKKTTKKKTKQPAKKPAVKPAKKPAKKPAAKSKKR